MIDKRIEQRLKAINLKYVLSLSMRQLSKYLVDELRVFESEKDLKLFILEYIGKTFEDDNTDFPIRYYEVLEEDLIKDPELRDDEFVQLQVSTLIDKDPVNE
ncbi:hypothetical protein [Hathewaya limosa]|uniref:Uncharacterized protein n=1 Tax=Hathewaya limosa TaxID=1536 RepID=A0ABU0JSU9_HATLI|nr:hypothetical protein [Hathewaya limosa]AWZ48638.1 hypothetical protein C3495_07340 [Clostridiaceae bacterium 14S0207]MDQ0480166.1 hypothetical protein [Hathewaya limosa]